MRFVLIILFAAVVIVPIYLISQVNNDPYPASEKGKNIFYSSFSGEPKHLDPARAYSSDEYEFLNQVCEPVFQYHYLIRKPSYKLVPLTCEQVPEPKLFDKDGKELGPDAPIDSVAKSVYDIKLKPGIRYEDHPCFAKDASGKYRWHLANGESFPKIEHPHDLPGATTRTLRAEDYVYEIKRLANPMLECPIGETLAGHIEGFGDLQKKLDAEITRIREERRKNGGIFFNQEADEKSNPIYLDMRKFDLPGAQVIDELTFRITLTNKYPQMRYWLAMPFFTPVPWEADRFYTQSAAIEQNIVFDRFPIGTGAYTLSMNAPNYRMVLEKNPNYHDDFYPSEGDPEDAAAGLLADAGKKLPFLDQVVFVLEKEPVPRWNKLLQGYYDSSGIASDVFDQAVKVSNAGNIGLTPEMEAKHITLSTAVESSTYYFSFNMNDEVFGGLDEKRQKLRQAISIAMNVEEEIQIFQNGRGIPAQTPIPPGIFGYQESKDGINPFVYEWDEKNARPWRKTIEDARKLMTEAGYPGGHDADGKALIINYDYPGGGSADKSYIDWLRKQFKLIGMDLHDRVTDYNRFQEKALKGDFQLLSWGWNADYPDPENFLFLLYGPNGKVKSQGENVANYDSKEFDAGFKKMEVMNDSPERMTIIRGMLNTARKDAPWIWGYHPVAFGLRQEWLKNSKPMLLGGNSLKYVRIDAKLREERRAEWNSPVRYPIWIAFALLAVTAVPAAVMVYRRERSAPV